MFGQTVTAGATDGRRRPVRARGRWRIAGILAAAALVLGANPPPAGPAARAGAPPSQAVPGSWQRPVPGGASARLETDPKGGITVQDCDGSDGTAPATRRFSATGTALPGAPAGALAMCVRTVTGSGLTVGIRPRPRTDNRDPSIVVAYRGADLVWSRPITSTCNNAPLGVWKLMNGADGNVYGTASAYTPCGPQQAVFGISAATGALLFVNRSASAYELVGTHRRGLVATYGDDSEGVRFLDYRGREYGRVKVVGSAREMAQRLAVNPDGYVFAYLTDRTGTTTRPDCGAYYAANRMEVFNTSGRTGRYTFPYCTTANVNDWSAASWGMPVLLSGSRTDVPNPDRVMAFDTKARRLFSRTVLVRGEDRAYGALAVHADSRGRILLPSNMVYDGYTRVSLHVDVLSHSTGALLDSFDSGDLDGALGQHTNVYGFADDRVYFIKSVCADQACTTWQRTLFSLGHTGVGMDEPRATLLKSARALPAPVRMAALGDSYSSGEGNPPFDAGSGTCHRTAQAWPRLVGAEDPGVHLVGHFACSGAKASAFTESFKGESAQVTKQLKGLSPAPGLVTLTIGGNDVGFSRILTHCFVSDCVADRTIAHAESYVAGPLPGLLRSSYALVRSTVPRTSRVLVVGYPRLFPEQQEETTRCGWLTPAERTGLNRLAAKLDAASRTAAGTAKVSYLSVSGVLDGHELCSAKPWVYDVGRNGGDNRGHPLPDGQRALAKAVRGAIAAG
ncbi:SGNH/GDSL hydrolase family protein [Streptomyces sp. NPDC101118]|uniref:SGNH/GDSL hydrolase family protein n=1 Tax=Streptomyces sp. NPDC101118 TaxID=3366109 RepID=UPI00381130EA